MTRKFETLFGKPEVNQGALNSIFDTRCSIFDDANEKGDGSIHRLLLSLPCHCPGSPLKFAAGRLLPPDNARSYRHCHLSTVHCRTAYAFPLPFIHTTPRLIRPSGSSLPGNSKQ